MANPTSPCGEPLPERERGELASIVAAAGGESNALRALKIPRSTLARALAGLGLRAGTRALIRQRLADIQAWQRKGTPGDAA